jgi:stage III sporulation protein AD
MTVYFKTAACVLVSLVVFLVLSRQNKDISVVFSMAACCMVAAVAFTHLAPIMDLLRELQTAGDMDTELTSVLFRAVGIGILGELVSVLCSDAGNAALGKIMQFLSVVTILWVSQPIFRGVFELIEDVLTAL